MSLIIKNLVKHELLDFITTKIFKFLSKKNNNIKSTDIVIYNSYTSSLIYAIYLSYRSINHLRVSLSCLPNIQIQQCYSEIVSMNNTNIIFLCHNIMDTIKVIKYYPILGQMDMIIHHLIYTSFSLLMIFYRVNPLPGAWLGLSEISSIFLNLRFLLKLFNLQKNKIFYINNILFATSFFIFRILTWSYGILHILNNHKYISDNKYVKYYLLSVILSGYGLNIFWFKKILNHIK